MSLNDEIHTQIVSPGMKKLVQPGKKLDLILLLKILNWISQKFLTMPKTINTKSLTEAWEEEKCLLDVSSVIYKNCYKKVKSTKKLAEPYCQKPYCCS